MPLLQEQIVERVNRCLIKPERLSLGEVEILRSLLGRAPKIHSLRHAEEQELQKIERKLGIHDHG